MKINIPKKQIEDCEHFIRRCGYGRVFDRRTKQVSYAKRLHRDLYPRFHVYIKESSDNFILNLHLDQRQTRYAGAPAHSGEYDGLAVEKESERIKSFLI